MIYRVYIKSKNKSTPKDEIYKSRFRKKAEFYHKLVIGSWIEEQETLVDRAAHNLPMIGCWLALVAYALVVAFQCVTVEQAVTAFMYSTPLLTVVGGMLMTSFSGLDDD